MRWPPAVDEMAPVRALKVPSAVVIEASVATPVIVSGVPALKVPV